MTAERFWKVAAILLSVAAVTASLQTVLSARRHREILDRKEQSLAQIQATALRWAQEDRYRTDLETQQAWQPADLEELATKTLGQGVARISQRPATPAGDGWQRREASLDIRDAPYAEVAMLLEAAAMSQPPWRLREIEIRPSAQAGRGAATLGFEALEKKRP